MTDVVGEGDLRGMHPNEVVGWESIPLERCIDMIYNRKIVDVFSIAALLSYRLSQARDHPGA